MPSKASLLGTGFEAVALVRPQQFQPQQAVCFGPVRVPRVFDRAMLGNVRLTASVIEERDKAVDSIVMMKDKGILYAGRGSAFLLHSPPVAPAQAENEANIAVLKWLKAAAPRQAAAAACLSGPEDHLG